MHEPGIEPEADDWKSSILPLNYACLKDDIPGSELPESNRRPFDN